MADVESKIEAVFSLFDKHGNGKYIGEKVSQLQHAQQASQFAKAHGFPDHVILGAFLHDIGHLVGMEQNMEKIEGDLGYKSHESIGKEFLEGLGFPQGVLNIVGGHVSAKRYLVFSDPTYHDKLSEASKGTLIDQGGPMSAEEAAEFEKNPDKDALVQLRQWDDEAKVEDIPATDNDYYIELARRVLSA